MGTVVHLQQVVRRQVGVFLRRRERGVAEHFLDRAEVSSLIQQMSREGVAQRVRAHASPAQSTGIFLHDPFYAARGQAPAPIVSKDGGI